MTQCNIHSAKVNPAPVLAARTSHEEPTVIWARCRLCGSFGQFHHPNTSSCQKRLLINSEESNPEEKHVWFIAAIICSASPLMHIHAQGSFISHALKRGSATKTPTQRPFGRRVNSMAVHGWIFLSPDNMCIRDHHSTVVHPDSSGEFSTCEDNKS